MGVDSTVYSYTVPDPGYPTTCWCSVKWTCPPGPTTTSVISVRAGDDMTLVGTGYGVAENYGIAPGLYDATGVGRNGNAANFTFTHTGSAGAYLIVDISICQRAGCDQLYLRRRRHDPAGPPVRRQLRRLRLAGALRDGEHPQWCPHRCRWC